MPSQRKPPRRPRNARKRSDGSTTTILFLLSIVGAVVVGALVFREPLRDLVRGREDLARKRSRDADEGGVTIAGFGEDDGAPAPRRADPDEKEPIGRVARRDLDIPEHGPDDPRLRPLLDDSDRALEAGDIAKAIAIAERAETLDLGRAMRERAVERVRRLRLIQEVAERNPVRVESRAEGLYEFQVKGMGRFRGVIASEGPHTVRIQKDSGITVPIPPDRIEERIPITQRERSAELQKELEARRLRTRTTGERAGVGHWELARFAFGSGLREEAIELMKRAWALDPRLETHVYEERAKWILREWIYYMAADIDHECRKRYKVLESDFPESKALAMANEMREEEERAARAAAARPADRTDGGGRYVARTERSEPETAGQPDDREDPRLAALRRRGRGTEDIPEPVDSTPEPKKSDPDPTPREPVVEKTPDPPREPARREPRRFERSDGGGGGSLAARADAAFSEGMSLFREGSTAASAGEGRKLIRQATAKLDEAVDLYRKLVNKHPGNARYKKKLDSASRKLRWAGRFRRV